jgi:hypothetical protein
MRPPAPHLWNLLGTTTGSVRCDRVGLEPSMRGLGVACPYHNHASSMQLAWARTFDARFGCGLSLPQPSQFDATGSNLWEVWVWLPTTTIPEPLMRGLGVACPYHNHPSSMQLAWARTFDARFGCGLSLPQPSQFDATGLGSNL